MAMNIQPQPRVAGSPGSGNAVAGVEYGYRDSPLREFACGGEAGQSASDHDGGCAFERFIHDSDSDENVALRLARRSRR